MGPGAALLIPSGTYTNPDLKHLYIVCSAPNAADEVVIVSVSSWKNDLCDGTCILDEGCHSFITRKSWVMYRSARIEKVATLKSGLEQNSIVPKDDVSGDVLNAVKDGLMNSKHTPRQVKRFLQQLDKA